MSSGILGQANLSAGVNTTVYTVPASTLTACNIALCNRSVNSANIRIALAATGTPALAEYIEYDFVLSANGGTLERTGIMLQTGKNVVVYSDVADISVSVWGVEE